MHTNTHTHNFLMLFSVIQFTHFLIENPDFKVQKELKRSTCTHSKKHRIVLFRVFMLVLVLVLKSCSFLLIYKLIANACMLTQFTAKTFRNHMLMEIRFRSAVYVCMYECTVCRTLPYGLDKYGRIISFINLKLILGFFTSLHENS